VGARHTIIKDEKSVVVERPAINKTYFSKKYTPEKTTPVNNSIFENNEEADQ
jgi:hypothetical protein